MKKFFWTIPVIISALLFACSSGWNTYSQDMFHGKRLLQEEEYAQARTDFLRAGQAQHWAPAYAYAATASYKMGDLQSAERELAEAQRLDGSSYAYLRVLGYKGLTLLKEGRVQEGRDALAQYANLLRATSSPRGAGQVEIWLRQQSPDLASLERIIDEQVGRYESDFEQFQSTGTGFYNKPGNYRGGPSIVP